VALYSMYLSKTNYGSAIYPKPHAEIMVENLGREAVSSAPQFQATPENVSTTPVIRHHTSMVNTAFR
jgi:hypothetical protein